YVKRLLRREVMVDHRLGYAGVVGDLRDRRPVIAVRGKRRGGGIERMARRARPRCFGSRRPSRARRAARNGGSTTATRTTRTASRRRSPQRSRYFLRELSLTRAHRLNARPRMPSSSPREPPPAHLTP